MATRNFERLILLGMKGYAKLITKFAKRFSESSRVRNTIRSKVEKKGSKIVITTTAGGSKAPDARAREFGSGIHSQRGSKDKITIVPKNAPALVFPWDKAKGFIPRIPDGRVILKKVEHPGIEADNNGKGYMRPAQEKAARDIRVRLLKLGAKGIKLDINSVFKHANVR